LHSDATDFAIVSGEFHRKTSILVVDVFYTVQCMEHKLESH